MGNKISLLIISFLLTTAITGQYTVSSVPNQKLIDNSYVSDPDDYIDAGDQQQIEALCSGVEQSVGAQIAVVIVSSIGDANPHDFGTDLFNSWKLGREGYDDGLLVFLVMDVHRVEFITGYGIEDKLTDALCYDIQQNEMVPLFKEGAYGEGLINGLSVCADILKGGEPPVYIASYESSSSSGGVFLGILKFYFYYIVAPFTALFVLMYLITFLFKDPYKKYQTMKLFQLKIFMFLLPIPFIGVYYLVRWLIEHWRNTVRFSKKTGLAMVLMSEKDDDKYLETGQITEEKVKSIDYDVWVGEGADDVLILPYIKWFSGHSKCPGCKYKTYYLEYNITITPATYSSSGLGEKKYSCENCNYSRVSTYTIPRLQKSSSSSSSGSSGGSWGGGSSGGGGAGSSW